MISRSLAMERIYPTAGGVTRSAEILLIELFDVGVDVGHQRGEIEDLRVFEPFPVNHRDEIEGLAVGEGVEAGREVADGGGHVDDEDLVRDAGRMDQDIAVVVVKHGAEDRRPGKIPDVEEDSGEVGVGGAEELPL